MRVISQDGTIDVSYENGNLIICTCKSEDVKGAGIYYHDSSSPRGTKLAKYSSKEKAIKAMEMLRDQYMQYATARSDDYWFAFNNPKVFQFPKDEEIEVEE